MKGARRELGPGVDGVVGWEEDVHSDVDWDDTGGDGSSLDFMVNERRCSTKRKELH
jgi:hypothetical protein